MGMFQLNWVKELIGEPGAKRDEVAVPAIVAANFAPGRVLLAYATQTGVTEDLANATHEQLLAAGIETELVELNDLEIEKLAATPQALFLTSTTCDGDPPDMAEAFAEERMVNRASLEHLRYGLLALGDRAYDHFCGFGHALDEWLRACGAQPWFPCIEVDDEDSDALDRWHAQVAALVPNVAAAASAVAP